MEQLKFCLKTEVQIPGGQFEMGSDRHYPEERPKRRVAVSGFRMDRCTVTNAQFRQFVANTGYVTTAEIPLDPDRGVHMPPEYFAAGSLVFKMTGGPVDLKDFRQWWDFVPGAFWDRPEGPGSSIEGREDHPVVQVSLYDALAYCAWVGKELPVEKEWEYAARDGTASEFPWGSTLTPHGVQKANTWLGEFPWQNLKTQQAPFSCPVGSHEPSRFGLYNMIGNVWEWTLTPFETSPQALSNCCTPAQKIAEGGNYVVKGGSFLCAPSYCRRYRATARSPQEARSSTNHLGFRCILR